MSDPDDQKIRELAWQRELPPGNAAELEAFLANHPEKREDWELELELNRMLQHLPAAPPVATNFTSQVLQAVERERRANQRRGKWPQWFAAWRWLPRAAAAMIVVGLTTFGYLQHQVHTTRAVMAGDVAQIAEIVSASDPVVMKNYEAIRRMGDSQPEADAELIALFK